MSERAKPSMALFGEPTLGPLFSSKEFFELSERSFIIRVNLRGVTKVSSLSYFKPAYNSSSIKNSLNEEKHHTAI